MASSADDDSLTLEEPKVAFSSHLPDDEHLYILDAVPMLGAPRTMIIPERYRRELPPLPSILALAWPA
jgi:hypothetical protein